jgi:alkylated DNA repair dioxygenase AlkB
MWQPGLFGACAGLPSFQRVARHPLDRGAWVEHGSGWLPDPDPLFAALCTELPWRGDDVEMYGRIVAQPRLGVWWKLGLEPELLTEAGTACLARIARVADQLSARYGVDIDAIGCNLYRTGADSVAFHGDRHARTDGDPDAVVAIVSLGSPRRLLLRPRGGGRSRAFVLHPGDLFVMGGSCQRTWEHGIPKAVGAGPRISVTFRHPVR